MGNLHRALCLSSLLALGGGCAHHLGVPASAATVKAASLPDDVEHLVVYADEQMAKETPVSVENALVALDKAIAHGPGSGEALWRAARACAWLADEYKDKPRRESFAHRGADYGKGAMAVLPSRVESPYYLALTLGLWATTKTVGAYELVPQVVKAAKDAAAVDERFDGAGPLRVLGSVYAKAPPWPVSVGDVDEGVKILTRATQLAPDHPLNHLLFGDALLADERYADAEREYRAVLAAPLRMHKQTVWREQAEAGLRRLEKKRRSSDASF